MEPDTGKKLGVVGVVSVIIAVYILLLLFMYFIVEAPLSFIAVFFVVYVSVAIVLVYHANKRFKEIEEGLEDAVDNY